LSESKDNFVKIIFSGLDNAGKTSILTALERKYNFEKEVSELKPTIRVNYQSTKFLGNDVKFWDMGGQSKYRELYKAKAVFYFADTDLLVYLIDIQDKPRIPQSLEYLGEILKFFSDNDMDVPIIVTFHKFDPDIKIDDKLINWVMELKQKISDDFPNFKILYQQTSIYDIISIVQLVSYGLSLFDEQFFDLSELLEKYVEVLNCLSLILFDKNGIIISEFYNDKISAEMYVEFLEDIREHLFLLKRMEEENTLMNELTDMEGNIISYLHRIEVGNENFFISSLFDKDSKDKFEKEFVNLKDETIAILKEIT